MHRPIWREVFVPVDISLRWVHEIIQAVMGWDDVHLHSFQCKGRCFSRLETDAGFDDTFEDESQAALGTLLGKAGQSFDYTYDFGDCWEHRITRLRTLPEETDDPVICCIAGEGEAPFEDCGGPPGYEKLCQDFENGLLATNDVDMLFSGEWIPDDFDPELFDIDSVNDDLSEIWALHEEAPRGLGPAAGKEFEQLQGDVFGGSEEMFGGNLFDFMDDDFDEVEEPDAPPHPYQDLSAEELSQFAELLQIGERIRQLEPWKDLWDNDLFCFEDPESGAPCLVSVLGGGKEVFAIHVYRPPDGIQFWKRAFTGVMPTLVEAYQQSLNLAELQFTRKADLEAPDLDLYSLVGHKHPPRGPHRWLKFFNYHPRSEPWFLPVSEVPLLKIGLLLCERYIQMIRAAEKSEVTHLLRPQVETPGTDLPETLPTFSLPGDDAPGAAIEGWAFEQRQFDWDETAGAVEPFVPGEFALQRIALLPEVGEVWEVGAVFLKNPVMTQNGPVIPIIALTTATAAFNGMPPSPRMEADPNVTAGEVVWACFEADCLARECRPSQIRVTTNIGERVFAPLSDYCPTRVERAEAFELLEALLQSLTQF